MKLIKLPFCFGFDHAPIQAPNAILSSIENFHLLKKTEPFDIVDAKISKYDETNANRAIYAAVKKCKDKFIALGGDHAITYSSYKAFSRNFKNAGIIIFDAHADVVPYKLSSPKPDNFISLLLDEGILKGRAVLIVGLRNFSDAEKEFISRTGINVHSSEAITQVGLKKSLDIIIKFAKKFSALYLSLDLDVIDPAFAPGIDSPEIGGLDSRELIYLVQGIKRLGNLNGADLVEVCPSKDVRNLTSLLCAKIVLELL